MADPPTMASILLACLSGPADAARRPLEDDGFRVTPSFDLVDALHRLEDPRPDLLVIQLDGRRPDDWRQCQCLTQAASQPAFVLADDQAVETRLAALASGADDVLASPFHPLELVARVRALLRRAPLCQPASSVLSHDDLELDPGGHLATLGSRELPLTPLEFRLLQTLLEQPHRTFSREELLARVHTLDRPVSERSIDLHVAELRHKLGDVPAAPRYVETVRGVGYRLARASGIRTWDPAPGEPRQPGGQPLAAVLVGALTVEAAERLAAELRRRGYQAAAASDQAELIARTQTASFPRQEDAES